MRFTSAAFRSCVVVSILAALAASGAAQTTATSHHTLFAIDPLSIPWDIFQAELETGIGGGATIGAVGSYTDISNDRYATIDIKARYYPSEELFNKLSTGLSMGYTRFSREVTAPCALTPGFGGGCTSANTRAVLDAPTVGVILDYNWMHGASRRFVVGTGIGAKRILASASARDRLGLDRAYVTGRFVIGIAF